MLETVDADKQIREWISRTGGVIEETSPAEAAGRILNEARNRPEARWRALGDCSAGETATAAANPARSPHWPRRPTVSAASSPRNSPGRGVSGVVAAEGLRYNGSRPAAALLAHAGGYRTCSG